MNEILERFLAGETVSFLNADISDKTELHVVDNTIRERLIQLERIVKDLTLPGRVLFQPCDTEIPTLVWCEDEEGLIGSILHEDYELLLELHKIKTPDHTEV